MTFIYKLDPYFLAIYRTCENELPVSRLSKVIVYGVIDIHTDRQTDTTEIIYHAASWVVNDQQLGLPGADSADQQA